MSRVIKAEILDALSQDDPAARKSRRELRIINHVMGNFRWFARTVPALLRPGERVIEIGAGDGSLSGRLARIGVAADGLDVCPAPAGWPAARKWHRCDVREFDGFDAYGVVLANLVLHHFSDRDLAELGRNALGGVRAIVACEPERRRRWRILCAAFRPLVGPVTRHDARASIDAGFRGAEIAQALGLDGAHWNLSCSGGGIGSSRLVAERCP